MGGITQSAKTALRLSPVIFFLGIFSCCITAAAQAASLTATSCSASAYDDSARIRYIHDGDTLHLVDGRKIRLIGINTPELARDDKPAEPFSLQARDALIALFKTDKSVKLILGEQKKDHYQRTLAHIFDAQGRNIQAILLNQGFARLITFPPNSRFQDCYRQQEREARCNKRGLWQHAEILAADEIKNSDIGFQLITGTVTRITTNSKGIWLTLGEKLTLGIRPDNLALFDKESIQKLLGQQVVVRGWLNKSRYDTPYYLRLRHPSSIELKDNFACKP